MSQIQEELVFGEATDDIESQIPDQGDWTEDGYLRAFPHRGYELSDGYVEVLPMPTEEHQEILIFLLDELRAFVTPRDLGKVQVAGMRVRLWNEKLREPDLVVMLKEHDARRENRFWQGADLAVEIVSDGDPDRDWKVKRAEYARAGIPEYWIVDPRDRTVTVLTLPEGAADYHEAGRYGQGDTAASLLLDGFELNVSDVFAVK